MSGFHTVTHASVYCLGTHGLTFCTVQFKIIEIMTYRVNSIYWRMVNYTGSPYLLQNCRPKEWVGIYEGAVGTVPVSNHLNVVSYNLWSMTSSLPNYRIYWWVKIGFLSFFLNVNLVNICYI